MDHSLDSADSRRGSEEPSPESSSSASVRRRPVPSKGHRKSRKGCFSCKRRRVKCSEELPRCRACRRIGLECEYPSPALPLASSMGLRALPPALRLEDFRFFHHFIVSAYPPLPLGVDRIWQDVAAMSHEYDYLIHAMLALSAQHLTASNEGDYSVQALGHRVAAIAALNEALSQPCTSRADGDAKWAAAMVLTFQSSYMPDGMMEFLAMLRGLMVIQTTVVPSVADSSFAPFTEDAYVESMRSLLETNAASWDEESGLDVDLSEIMSDFTTSLRLVAPLCQSVAELEYLSALERVALLAIRSPTDACLELILCYALTNDMDADAFTDFTKPTNLTAQVLLAHFWMLTQVIERRVLGPTRPLAIRDHVARCWVEDAAQRLPETHKQYVFWPLGMATCPPLG